MDPRVFREWLEIDDRLRRAILERDAARRRSEAGADDPSSLPVREDRARGSRAGRRPGLRRDPLNTIEG